MKRARATSVCEACKRADPSTRRIRIGEWVGRLCLACAQAWLTQYQIDAGLRAAPR